MSLHDGSIDINLAHQLFVKKGSLGKIWLAGTLFKKLSKRAIMSSNVEEMVDQIRDPVVKLALCTQVDLEKTLNCVVLGMSVYSGSNTHPRTRPAIVTPHTHIPPKKRRKQYSVVAARLIFFGKLELIQFCVVHRLEKL